jgi:autotransporter-associated beta strand protein
VLSNPTNSHTGGTYVEAGTLTLGSTTAIPAGGSVNPTGIQLTLTAGQTSDQTVSLQGPLAGGPLTPGNTVAGNLSLSSVALSASDLGSGLLAYGTKFTLINYGGTWNGGGTESFPISDQLS